MLSFNVRFVPHNNYSVGWHIGLAPSVRLFTRPTYQPIWASMQISHLCKKHHDL